VILLSHRPDLREVRRQAEQVDRRHRLRSELPFLQDLLYFPIEVVGAHLEGVHVDIHENRRRPFERDHLSGGEEREVGYEHCVPLSNAPGFQCQGHRFSSASAAYAMLHSYVSGKFRFQLLDRLAHDVCA